MAESWVRLWAGTTTDPKWQTIARKSGQPRCLVIALFTHMLMVANESEQRGSVLSMSIEDTASALDCDEQQVADILDAMEGRVVEGGMLSGWNKRQPAREDSGNEKTGAKSSTERVQEYRKRQKEQVESNARETQCNAMKRDETQRNAPEAEAEADVNNLSVVERCSAPKDGGEKNSAQPAPTRRGLVCGLLRKAGMADAAPHYLTDEVWETILAKRSDEEILEVARAKMATRPGQRTGLKYIAPALLQDPEPIDANARASPARRPTLTETRANTIAELTGKNRNYERQIANERDITGEAKRIA